MKKITLNLLFTIAITASLFAKNNQAKYIFLFIGDGMGINQMYAAELYLQAIDSANGDLLMNNFPLNSTMTTTPANNFVTGSAAAATAMSTGFKTNNGILGKSPNLNTNYETFSVKVKRNGLKVGILSSVAIDHATPAGFYAHQDKRDMYYEISMELPNYNIDFFGGGGFHFPKGEENDQPDAFENAISKGYTLVNKINDFNSLGKTNDKILLVNPDTYSQGEMFWEIDREPNSLSLADITKKGIEVLDNPNGFFMMVEGGKIDWAAHGNDATSLIHEVIAFDDAVKVAYEFYKKRPKETLIIVTADHETGSMFMGINYSINIDLLQNQTISNQEFTRIIEKAKVDKPDISFEEILSIIEKYFGLGNTEKGLELTELEKNFIYKAYVNEVLKKQAVDPDADYLSVDNDYSIGESAILILNNKAGVGWGSMDHSAMPVPVFAIGAGKEQFMKQFDNTELPGKMSEIFGFDK